MEEFMKYFFPIMILWFARSYPAGLAIYWAGGQIMQIFFNFRIKSKSFINISHKSCFFDLIHNCFICIVEASGLRVCMGKEGIDKVKEESMKYAKNRMMNDNK